MTPFSRAGPLEHQSRLYQSEGLFDVLNKANWSNLFVRILTSISLKPDLAGLHIYD